MCCFPVLQVVPRGRRATPSSCKRTPVTQFSISSPYNYYNACTKYDTFIFLRVCVVNPRTASTSSSASASAIAIAMILPLTVTLATKARARGSRVCYSFIAPHLRVLLFSPLSSCTSKFNFHYTCSDLELPTHTNLLLSRPWNFKLNHLRRPRTFTQAGSSNSTR